MLCTAVPVLAAAALPAAVPTVTLRNAAHAGVEMPVMGFGTGGYGASYPGHHIPYGGYPECWMQMPGVQCGEYVTKAVGLALDAGYRRFDSADAYMNQDVLGAALNASGVPRAELFLTSKVGDFKPMGYDDVMSQVDGLLKALRTDYVDLLLVHWPTSVPSTMSPLESKSAVCNTRRATYDEVTCRAETWRAMVDVWNAGKARAIGVSNYNTTHLQEMVDAKVPLPAVNQCYFHIYRSSSNKALLDATQRLDIVYNSYSPLGVPDWHKFPPSVASAPSGRSLDEPKVAAIARSHGKSAAQVMLAWQLALGMVTNPRSMNATHMAENLDVFDFNLTDAEMDVMMSFPQSTCDKDNWLECDPYWMHYPGYGKVNVISRSGIA